MLHRFVRFLLTVAALAMAQSGVAVAADMVLLTGRILTVDRDFSVHQALAISDGRILAVGTDAEISRHVGKQTEVMDFLTIAAKKMREQCMNCVTIIGPFPASMEKKAGYYHAQLWLRSKRKQDCQRSLQELVPIIRAMKTPSSLRWGLDIDPMSVL